MTAVVASGGTSTDGLTCTVGQPFFSANAGMWVNATGITTGIDGVFSDGDIVVENVSRDKALSIKLTDQMIAEGAFYNVYTISGMLLESDKIDSTSYVLKYDHLLGSKFIIVTINTSKGVVSTYKLSK